MATMTRTTALRKLTSFNRKVVRWHCAELDYRIFVKSIGGRPPEKILPEETSPEIRAKLIDRGRYFRALAQICLVDAEFTLSRLLRNRHGRKALQEGGYVGNTIRQVMRKSWDNERIQFK